LLRLRVTVLFRHTEVDYMDDIGGFCARSADEEVVGLDVSVDEVLLVYRLYSRQLLRVRCGSSLRIETQPYHLLRNHYHGLDGESPVTVIEEVFQTRPKQVDDENVVQAFLAKVINIRNTRWM
jgi:hypothetical protein